MGDARAAALAALEKCRRAGAWSDAVLGGVMDAAKLENRDRALAAALCYGVLQNRMLLDFKLQGVSSLKLGKVEPKVLDILRISAYQLMFLDKIPPSAAVNEGVGLCRRLGYARAAGYVNAVLRKVAADPGIPQIGGTAAERLSIRYSHPLWLTEYLVDALGEADAEQYLICDNVPAPLTMQVNTLKTDAGALRAELEAEGIETVPHPFLPDCLTANAAGSFAWTAAFREGRFFVQDAAANMAVRAAAPQPRQKILDACAAPGGKSFAAAVLSGGRAEITACDIHENKLKRIREGAARLGLDIACTAADARERRPAWDGAFDLVIADVPCSGLGVIRKKPDIRYKDPADFAALPEIQLAILKNVMNYVNQNGVLLYATCTVRSEENGDVIRRFLAEDDAFAPEEFVAANGAGSEGGCLQFWPQRHGTDGFFVAKLRRIR